MTRIGVLSAGLAVLMVATLAGCTPAEEGAEEMGKKLQAGDRAPEFTLPGSDGKTYALGDFAGKQAVVIAWFPKAFTGG